MTSRKVLSCSGLALRKYTRKKVGGAESRSACSARSTPRILPPPVDSESNNANTFDQRIPQCDGGSKGVEKRQRGENRVRFFASSRSRNCETFPMILRWLSTAPFRSPVLPLVKSNTASACPPCLGISSKRKSKPAGMRIDRIHHRTIRPFNSGRSSIQLQNMFRPWKIFHAFDQWRRRDRNPEVHSHAAGFISRASYGEI